MVLENKYLRKAVAKAGFIVMVVTYDKKTNSSRTDYISPNAVDLGINVELVNKGLKLIYDYIHPEDRNKVRSTLNEAIEAKLDGYNHEYRMVDDAGNIYEVSNDIAIVYGEDSISVECYIKNVTNKKREKREKKEKKRELRLEEKNAGREHIDMAARATKDRIPEIMEMFAKAYEVYSAFVGIDGKVVFPPTGPATNMGDFYDLFETPTYKDYFKFIMQRVDGADAAVLLDREEGGDGKFSAVPIKVGKEMRGVWLLGSYTVDESETLADIGEDQWTIAGVMSDYLTKSATLEVESAKSKGAGIKLRDELIRQGIINDALNKINSKLIDTVDVVVEETLRDVGMHMNLDKIALYGYEKFTDEFVIKSYWDVAGSQPSEEYMYELPKRRFIIENELKNNPDRYAVDSTNMTSDSKIILMRYNVNASITFALYRGDKLSGIIFFGSSKGERIWTNEELRFAKSISLIVQNMMENAEDDDNIRNVNKHLIDTYNNFNVGVFVKEAKTGEILFSNKVMNEMMGKDFVGGNSREIITDLHDKFDNVGGMRKQFMNQNKVDTWRSYIKRFDAIMDITEVNMEWLNGQPASLFILRKAKEESN